ncbi:MAG: hypothetical protein AAFR36_32545 [Bacteroidota bacterium]
MSSWLFGIRTLVRVGSLGVSLEEEVLIKNNILASFLGYACALLALSYDMTPVTSILVFYVASYIALFALIWSDVAADME